MHIKHLLSLIILAIGFGSGETLASEPSVYSKLLTPSPFRKDRILAFCSVKKTDNTVLNSFYDTVPWGEFLERELVLVEVTERTVSTLFSEKHKNSRGQITKARHHDYGDNLRRTVNCNDRFAFVLIGKDGSVKQRWEKSPPPNKLFATIDAMPMRQYEMRTRGAN